MTALALRPMSGGEILDASFQIYRRHFRPLFLLGLVAFAPMEVASVLVEVGAGATEGDGQGGLAILAALLIGLLVTVSVLGIAVAWIALIRAVEKISRGEEVHVPGELTEGLRRLPALAGHVALAYLLLMTAMIPAGLVGALGIAAAQAVGGAARGVATVLVALVVTGGMAAVMIWWTGIFFLGPPALVVEGIGPVRALERARELSRGARIRILGLGFLASLITFLPSTGILVLLGQGRTMWDPEAAATLSGTELLLQQIVSLGASALTTPFMAAVLVVLYLDRRVRVEGYDVELASSALAASA